MINHSGEMLSQVGIWIGIVNQLYATRMQQALGKHDLTIVQFSLLNHLARQPSGPQTISQLTEALEVNQPGVTKIVRKFEKLGYLTVSRDSADSRKRLISIDSGGFALIGTVMGALAPLYRQMFAEWEEAELNTFIRHLQKLGGWLDKNRLK